jgi:prophage tail gpP-like protein
MTIKSSEVATVVVEGRRFDDWETVFVQHRWADAWPIFRFTAAERDRPATLWQRLQFKPEDYCAVYLGGFLAITGVITVRQAAYDANTHGVMLQGVGNSWYAARASIVDKSSSYDGMTFEEVARKVLAPFGMTPVIIGKLNPTPYARLQNEPGENVWNFLERIARPRGIVLGSDHHGNILLIDDHVGPVLADLLEGDNILRCQATISIDAFFSQYIVNGQTAASDDQHGRQASEQQASINGKLRRYSPLVTPSEQPVWGIGEIVDRAKNEAVWHQGDEIHASITVQGWFAPRGGLWRAGDMVRVDSPMAMLNMVLAIQNATFTQDTASGTLTTLDLVAPWLLKAQGNWDVTNPNAPQPPGAATPNLTPPATPQSGTAGEPFPDQLDL